MKLKRQPKNIAALAFPEQFKRLRPESSAAGGVKARSGSEARRMEVYHGIRALFLRCKPWCAVCDLGTASGKVIEVHHIKGRAGLLLFDVESWLPVCRTCHRWIHDNPEEARRRGWLETNELGQGEK